MKTKIILGLVGILLVSFILYYFLGKSSFSGPVGGWEISKAKIEAKYGQSEQIKLAALQLGEAYQKVIDSPDANSGAVEIDDGMACILGVSVAQGIDELKASDAWEDIRDLVISTYEQQRRWIRFNSNQSGGVFPGINPDTKKCRFEVKNN